MNKGKEPALGKENEARAQIIGYRMVKATIRGSRRKILNYGKKHLFFV